MNLTKTLIFWLSFIIIMIFIILTTVVSVVNKNNIKKKIIIETPKPLEETVKASKEMTKKLTDSESHQSMLHYEGLLNDPTEMSICILLFNNDKIGYFDRTDVVNFNIDLLFTLDRDVVPNMKYNENNTIVRGLADKYGFINLENDKNESENPLYMNFIIYNKKTHTDVSRIKYIIINRNKYFYRFFEIKKINGENDLVYALYVVLNCVREKDEDELIQKAKNGIYTMKDDKGNLIVKYTNKIIKTGDHISFKDKKDTIDERIMKYMLLEINND